jgi:hypothetical protein
MGSEQKKLSTQNRRVEPAANRGPHKKVQGLAAAAFGAVREGAQTAGFPLLTLGEVRAIIRGQSSVTCYPTD